MKDRLLAIYFFLAHNLLLSQYEVGININGGISRRWAVANPQIDYRYRASFRGGFFYSYQINSYSKIKTEMNWQIFRYTEISQANWPTSYGYATYTRYRATSYLAVPIYYGFDLKKISFFVGVQTLVNNGGGSEMDHSEGVINGIPFVYDNSNAFGVRKIDFGPKVAVSWTPTNRFSFQMNYYHGILKNTPGGISSVYWSCLDFGAYYSIIKKEKKPISPIE